MPRKNIDDLPPTESEDGREDYEVLNEETDNENETPEINIEGVEEKFDLEEDDSEGEKSEEEEEAPVEEVKEPNIQYVGKKFVKDKQTGEVTETLMMPADEVPTLRINGSRRFELPSGEEQLAGFCLPAKDAAFLRKAYPDQFKRPVKKG